MSNNTLPQDDLEAEVDATSELDRLLTCHREAQSHFRWGILTLAFSLVFIFFLDPQNALILNMGLIFSFLGVCILLVAASWHRQCHARYTNLEHVRLLQKNLQNLVERRPKLHTEDTPYEIEEAQKALHDFVTDKRLPERTPKQIVNAALAVHRAMQELAWLGNELAYARASLRSLPPLKTRFTKRTQERCIHRIRKICDEFSCSRKRHARISSRPAPSP